MSASAIASLALQGLRQDIEGHNALNGDTEELLTVLLSDPLFADILATTWFRRLYDIPFMGALAYVDAPSAACQSRGHHSLIVGLFGLYCARRAGIDERATREWVLSAMLHDVHHPPFSHTLERSLKAHVDFSTRDFNIRIMRADTGGPNDESLISIAADHGVDLLGDTYLSKKRRYWPPFYRSTHNVDTLEGIVRTASANELEIPAEAFLRRRRILDVIATPYEAMGADRNTAEADFDWFWTLKDEVYRTAIYKAQRLLFESVIGEYLYRRIADNVNQQSMHLLSDSDVFAVSPEITQVMRRVWEVSSSCVREVGFAPHVREDGTGDPDIDPRASLFVLPVRRFVVRRSAIVENYGLLGDLRGRYEVRASSVLAAVPPGCMRAVEDAVGFSLVSILREYEGDIQDVLF
ncbi:MAG: HD domain-containing protein [Coriobacteriia bacterium]